MKINFHSTLKASFSLITLISSKGSAKYFAHNFLHPHRVCVFSCVCVRKRKRVKQRLPNTLVHQICWLQLSFGMKKCKTTLNWIFKSITSLNKVFKDRNNVRKRVSFNIRIFLQTCLLNLVSEHNIGFFVWITEINRKDIVKCNFLENIGADLEGQLVLSHTSYLRLYYCHNCDIKFYFFIHYKSCGLK